MPTFRDMAIFVLKTTTMTQLITLLLVHARMVIVLYSYSCAYGIMYMYAHYVYVQAMYSKCKVISFSVEYLHRNKE